VDREGGRDYHVSEYGVLGESSKVAKVIFCTAENVPVSTGPIQPFILLTFKLVT
jgi:hypothetical protein